MTCDVCGSSESYIQDGIAYCRECSEQIKGSIDEEAGEESYSKKALLSSPVSKKTRKKVKQTLAPWLHSEAYNLILFKQVSALIKLGCSEKLKTVVLFLWARYLQKCESAFMMSFEKEGITPHLSIFPSKRDAELLYGEGLVSNFRDMKRPYIQKTTKHLKRRKRKATKKTLDTRSSDSETCDSKSSDEEKCASSSHTKVKKKKGPCILYSVHARKLKEEGFTRHSLCAQKTCVSHMTVIKTLSFCHLGLLYTEDQMLLFDLLRLVKENAVPFFDILQEFPTSMQLQGHDARHLQVWHSPDIKEVSTTSAKLIKFLQLPKFKQPPLLPIAIRFVRDLNLPCDLIPVLKLLINKINKNPGKRKVNYIPPYEAQAMSVVAVALKMLFVLDGKYEVEHSEIMTKLNSVSKNETFFVWKDWQQQMTLKEYLFIKKYTTQDNAAMNLLDILNADRIIGSYTVRSFNEKLLELSKKGSSTCSSRNEIKALFEDLVTDTSIKKKPTSFPFQYELQSLMNGWRKLPLYKDTENIDFNLIGKDFSRHKLFYRPSATTDEIMNLLLTSLYESVKIIYVTEQADYLENAIRTSKKYWYIKHAGCNYLKKDWMDDLPSSFKWLLNFMCKYLEFDMSVFYKEFRYIEEILVDI